MPAVSEKDRVQIVLHLNDYLHAYIRLADAKAGALLALLAVLASLLVQAGTGGLHALGVIRLIGLGIASVSTALCLMVVWPRTPSSKTGIVSWHQVSRMKNASDYARVVMNSGSTELIRQLLEQNYYLARVATEKYSRLRLALGAAVVALLLWFCCTGSQC